MLPPLGLVGPVCPLGPLGPLGPVGPLDQPEWSCCLALLCYTPVSATAELSSVPAGNAQRSSLGFQPEGLLHHLLPWSYRELQYLVAGQCREVSRHYHYLLDKLVKSKAVHISKIEGYPLSKSECGLQLHHLCRRILVTIITTQNSCLLSRLGLFSLSHAFPKDRKEGSAHFLAHIRGRRIHDAMGTLWMLRSKSKKIYGFPYDSNYEN